jgi:hypothetical protein
MTLRPRTRRSEIVALGLQRLELAHQEIMHSGANPLTPGALQIYAHVRERNADGCA